MALLQGRPNLYTTSLNKAEALLNQYYWESASLSQYLATPAAVAQCQPQPRAALLERKRNSVAAARRTEQRAPVKPSEVSAP